jgi:hypothetical protein
VLIDTTLQTTVVHVTVVASPLLQARRTPSDRDLCMGCGVSTAPPMTTAADSRMSTAAAGSPSLVITSYNVHQVCIARTLLCPDSTPVQWLSPDNADTYWDMLLTLKATNRQANAATCAPGSWLIFAVVCAVQRRHRPARSDVPLRRLAKDQEHSRQIHRSLCARGRSAGDRSPFRAVHARGEEAPCWLCCWLPLVLTVAMRGKAARVP